MASLAPRTAQAGASVGHTTTRCLEASCTSPEPPRRRGIRASCCCPSSMKTGSSAWPLGVRPGARMTTTPSRESSGQAQSERGAQASEMVCRWSQCPRRTRRCKRRVLSREAAGNADSPHQPEDGGTGQRKAAQRPQRPVPSAAQTTMGQWGSRVSYNSPTFQLCSLELKFLNLNPPPKMALFSKNTARVWGVDKLKDQPLDPAPCG